MLLDVLQVARRRCIFSWKPFSTYCGAARVQPLVDYELMRSIDGPYPGGRRLPFPLRLMPQSNRWNGSIKRKASKMDLYVWKKNKPINQIRFRLSNFYELVPRLEIRFHKQIIENGWVKKKKKKKSAPKRKQLSFLQCFNWRQLSFFLWIHFSPFNSIAGQQNNKKLRRDTKTARRPLNGSFAVGPVS